MVLANLDTLTIDTGCTPEQELVAKPKRLVPNPPYKEIFDAKH